MAAPVCFLVPNLGNMGGSVRVAVQLANALSEDRDVSIVSCMHYDAPAFPVDSRIRCFDASIGQGRIREMVARAKTILPPIIEQTGCKLVFGIGTYETLMAVKPCRSLGIPLVFCDHGALINQWDDKQMRMVRLLCALFSKKTVTLTQRSLEDYARLLHIPRKRLQCIPNAIPKQMRMVRLLCALFSKKTVTLTQRSLEDYARLLHIPRKRLQCIPNAIPAQITDVPHAYDASAKKLLWAGRLDKEKGVDHLVAIAAKVLPRHPDWVWDVFGETVMTDGGFDVRAAIEEAGIGSQLVLRGRVDNMFELYDRYAICTLTSYREGLPLVLLEGMGCGLPLISFDVNTGPSDIIEDGVNGRLVSCYDVDEYADKLSAMMGDAALLQRMSDASLAAAGRFSEVEVVQAWRALADSIA